MYIWPWCVLICVCSAVAALITWVLVGYNNSKKLEEKERQRKLEEESKRNAGFEKAQEVAKKRNAVNYWINEIQSRYFQMSKPYFSLKKLYDEDPFSTPKYYSVGWTLHLVDYYEYLGNQYKVFIPFVASDGWSYALTIQHVACIYIADIIPLGSDGHDLSIPVEPTWNLPHIELPEYMMDTSCDRTTWRIKENFEYFKPHNFTIAKMPEEDETDTESLDFNDVVRKMATSIENFGKSLRGEENGESD